LGLDVSLDGGGGGGGESEAGDGGEGGAGLSKLAVSGSKIVAPLREGGREEGGREGGREKLRYGQIKIEARSVQEGGTDQRPLSSWKQGLLKRGTEGGREGR